MKKDFSTEDKILKAAEEVFQQKGFDGARMQEIADQANINKGLLHYYFKTKDKLFEAIFKKSFNQLMSKLEDILGSDLPLFDKLEQFIDEYMGLLLRNPLLPRFVIHELNTNADEFIRKNFVGENTQKITAFIASIQCEVDEKKIKPVDPRQLLINIIALCIFPFLGRPMLQVALQQNDLQFKQLLQERKQHVVQFIKDALTP